MNRCAALFLALPLALSALAADAQTLTRRFPQKALRGELAFGDPPLLSVNGQVARLAPGARVRNEGNLIVTPGSVTGTKAVANYTLDGAGQVLDVWLLRPDEARNPWPRTPAEADALVFDTATQSWTRP